MLVSRTESVEVAKSNVLKLFEPAKPEDLFRGIVEQSGDAVLLLDVEGEVRYASPGIDDVWGRRVQNGQSMQLLRLIHPDDRNHVRELLDECTQGEGARVRGEFRCRASNDEWKVLEGIAVNRLCHPDVRGIVVTLRDATDRKREQLALQSSERRYALAARMASDGLWEWDRHKDRLNVSARWKEMLGYEANDIGPSPSEWFDRIHPEDRVAVQARIRAIDCTAVKNFEFEHRLQHRSLGYRWMRCRGLVVRDDDEQPIRLAGSLTDITDYKAAEERLKYEAAHDPLTGLPNRSRFMAELARVLARTQADPNFAFAVLYIDLDRFKVINDSLGHLIGDQLLVAFATRLKRCIRPTDLMSRLGGDEFAVLLPGLHSAAEASIVADRIYQGLAKPVDLQGREVFASISMGIVMSTSGYDDATSVLRDADAAMYSAKASGRSRYVLFDNEMHERAVALLELETDLRRALTEEEFVLHFQPIVDLQSSEITGFEALVRWQHPERGLLSPAEFIPLAEETGLILQLGRWVLEEACRRMVMWKQTLSRPPQDISVNISAKQFSQPHLSAEIADILKKTGADPRWLILEVTESAIMADMDSALEILNELRAMGIRIHIDDFGSGYSALSYLYQFPIDTLKIDRHFVGNMDVEHRQSAIVQAIISLAQHLDIGVIAEGVDSEKQLAQLRDMECAHAQGFYFSRPVDAQSAESLLEAGSAIPADPMGSTS